MAQVEINDHLVLIGGESTGGKTASLRDIENPEGVMYLNCEAGKKRPFKAPFCDYVITDPLQVYQGFQAAETQEKTHTIVVDSLTFLMDMYESIHVLPAVDGQKGWQDFQQYFKNLMQQYVAASTKNVIFTAHVLAQVNKQKMTIEKKVPIKGALKNNGIEAYFSVVVAAKKMALEDLESYQNPMLQITEEEAMLGFKHVYQTKLTKDTVGERIRAPMGMWETNETFIDNNAQFLMNRLREYYA